MRTDSSEEAELTSEAGDHGVGHGRLPSPNDDRGVDAWTLAQLLMEHTSEYVLMVGPDLQILAYNRAPPIADGKELLGLRLDQILPMPSAATIGEAVSRVFATEGDSAPSDDNLLSRPGPRPEDEATFAWKIVPIREQATGRVNHALLFCRDDTLQREAATMLRESRQRNAQVQRDLEAQLRQQQKLESIGTLASGVAHEINNPIHGIMNYATLMKRSLDPDSQLSVFADEIITECLRVASIVRSLLAFARQDREGAAPILVKTIIDGALSLMRAVLQRNEIAIQVSGSDDLPEIVCRGQQIQQVVMNLLTNARDALNERFPDYDERKVVRITATMFEQNDEDWVRITVADQGAGIPAEAMPRVFDPFFTTKDVRLGTGLGLSVSHGIVQDHGGNLWVESEVGRGTRFYLELPSGGAPALDGGQGLISGDFSLAGD